MSVAAPASIGDELFTGGRRVRPEHDIEHALWQARLVGQFAPDRAEAGRIGSRLENDGAAGQKRGDDLSDIDVMRHVPRRDRRDNAYRLIDHLAMRGHVAELAAAHVLFPGDLIEGLEIVVPTHVGVVDMGHGDSAQRGSRFEAGEFDQPVAMLLEKLAQARDQPQAFGAILGPAPFGLVEGAACGADGLVDIGAPAHHLARPWPDHVEGLAAFGIAQLSVDVELGVGELRHAFSS